MTSHKINQLARNGEFEKVPKEHITKETLLTKGIDGMTTICWIITNNQLKHVPKNLLTDEILSQKDLLGASGYLLAARKPEQFEEIPKHLITADKLKEDQDQEKIWGMLIRSGNIKHVLPFCKDLIDDTELDHKSSFLHACATVCQLNQIPSELFTQERILKEKTVGKENVIHYAAHYGCLDQIPTQFLTNDTMNTTNCHGETPLHSATDGGKLNLVPKKFITQENLEKEDNWGTVFHKAALNSTFDTFPKEFLTEKNLMLKSTNNGVSAIYLLAQKCSNPTVYTIKKEKSQKQFSKMIHLLSTKNLKDLIDELTQDKWDEALKLSKEELTKRKILEDITKDNHNLTI